MAPAVTAAVHEAPSWESEWVHRTPPRRRNARNSEAGAVLPLASAVRRPGRRRRHGGHPDPLVWDGDAIALQVVAPTGVADDRRRRDRHWRLINRSRRIGRCRVHWVRIGVK